MTLTSKNPNDLDVKTAAILPATRSNGFRISLPLSFKVDRRPVKSGVRPLHLMNHCSAFVHVLTIVHAMGAVACFVMSAGSAASVSFRDTLAMSGGSTIMVEWFGPATWAFLLFIGLVLTTLAYASWRIRPWAWHLTLLVYGIGVIGSLWQVGVGIEQGWVSAAINSAVVAYAATPAVKRAYRA